MTPVKVFGDYVVCFEAEKDYENKRDHFVKFCGWTPAQYKKIKDFAWFTAKVSIWKQGVSLSEDYLGACCYETEEEFYTKYACDYFSDMALTCAQEIKDENLLARVKEWREELRRT